LTVLVVPGLNKVALAVGAFLVPVAGIRSLVYIHYVDNIMYTMNRTVFVESQRPRNAA
jgi:hypothetical protein